MSKITKILIWTLLITFLNVFGRYLYVAFSTYGYTWIKDFYIVVSATIATIISLIIFFTADFIITKKRKELKSFSFTKTRLLIMTTTIIIAYIGEKIYLLLSDYFLFN